MRNKKTDILESEFQQIVKTARLYKAELKDKKILVTGANGFLGQYIVGAISLASREMKLGCKIDAVGMSRPRPVLASILKKDKNISYRKIDLTKNFNLSGYDFIFHSAGYGQPAKFLTDPLSTIVINVQATNQLIKESPNSTFVFFSSSEIYGDVPKEKIPVNENYNGNVSLDSPRAVYAESKRLGEALCSAYAKNLGSKIKIVRISPTYGPGLPLDDSRVMSDFIRKALTGKTIEMLDGGTSVKSFGYISNTISMILYTAFHGKDMVYNVGGKDSISILEIVKTISKHCKVPYTIPSRVSSPLSRDQKVIKLDLRKIEQKMKGLKHVKFSEGITRTIEWTRKQKLL
jgi:dTDP-glucose 4,6-dehydratase/UDP-glucuronate decarboxylase